VLVSCCGLGGRYQVDIVGQQSDEAEGHSPGHEDQHVDVVGSALGCVVQHKPDREGEHCHYRQYAEYANHYIKVDSAV